MKTTRRYAHVLERSLAERSILEGSLVNNTPKRSGRTDNRPEREVPSGSLMDSKSASRLEAASTKDLMLARSMLSVTSVERISRTPDASNREQKPETFIPQLPQGLPGVFPPPFAGGVAPEPDFPWPVAGESPPKWDISGFERPWYGRYVGPTGNAWSKYFKNKGSMSMDEIIPLLPLPVTPVDRAAMYHDIEYFLLSEKYEWDNNNVWQAPWDLGGKGDPNFQRELAIADARLVKNSWSFMARGLDSGFYGGKFGGEHFSGDLVWSTAITATHFPLAIIRLTVYGTVSVGYALRDFVKTGNIGQFVESILKTGVNLVYGIGYTLFETTHGIADFGISLVKAVPGAIDRGLGLRPGTTAGAIVGGVIGGPVGAVVGAAIGMFYYNCSSQIAAT